MKSKGTVSITGGTGFIGGALAKRLLEDGFQPRIITRRPPVKRDEGMQYAVADYESVDSLRNAFSDSDYIVHAAAVLFARSREEFEKANVGYTANIVKAADSEKGGIKKIVYLSSLAAGGPSPNPDRPRTEDMKENPVSLYGKTKLAGEEEIKKLQTAAHTILRPPIVYGKKDSGFSKIAEMVRKGIMVSAGGDAFFSFIYIDDLTAAVRTALTEKNLDNKTFYVCENSVYRWKTFIRMMAEAMGVKTPLMIKMPPRLMSAAGLLSEIFTGFLGKTPVFNRDKAREANAGNWIAYSGKWERETNWRGWTPLKDGINSTFARSGTVHG